MKIMRKKLRGYYEHFVTLVKEVAVGIVTWKDNKSVNLLSIFVGATLEGKIRRFDQKIKTHVKVLCPEIIRIYNVHMSAVDFA